MNSTENGSLLSLTFEIEDEAMFGDSEVSVQVVQCINESGDNVPISACKSNVHICSAADEIEMTYDQQTHYVTFANEVKIFFLMENCPAGVPKIFRY